MNANNKYTLMQKEYYENQSTNMNCGNHRGHNANPDYWDILLEGVKEHPDWVCFDFGCGCGRNIINMLKLGVKKVDGCDISSNNIFNTKQNIMNEFGFCSSDLYVVSGTGIDSCVPDNKYDFVMSTIVMQHICVYDIRFSILQGKYRILKPNGILSFQMGMNDKPHERAFVKYYENYYDAVGTNSACDVYITNPEHVVKDLLKIGFKNVTYQIRPPFEDHHKNWIFYRAEK